MDKVILVYPGPGASINQFPTGIYKIASFCSKEFDIEILDERVENNLEDVVNSKIEKGNVICIGISVVTGPQINNALRLSKIFHGKIPIVWGGIHPTILPKQVISNKFVDYVIIGDGERAFYNLLQHLQGLKVEKELFLSKKNDNFSVNYVDIAEMRYLDFQKYNIKDIYFSKRDGFTRAFPIETSRGCPHKCYFCHNSINKRLYVHIKNESLYDLIDYLYSSYSIDGVIFQEDNLFVKKKRVNEILHYLLSIPTVRWKANSRINYFEKFIDDIDFMNLLVKSGCNLLQFGIESGSQRIVNLINKKIDLKKVRSVNRKLAKYPIKIRYNFIVGFPGESLDEINETFSFINTLRDENKNAEPPLLSVYTPYPGTVLFKNAIEMGFAEPVNLEEWSEVNWRSASRNCWLTPQQKKFIEQKSKEFAEKSFYNPYRREVI